MASIELDGYKLEFKNGSCACKNTDLRNMGQNIMDECPEYFANPHNYAVQELQEMGGVKAVLDPEPPPEEDIIH